MPYVKTHECNMFSIYMHQGGREDVPMLRCSGVSYIALSAAVFGVYHQLKRGQIALKAARYGARREKSVDCACIFSVVRSAAACPASSASSATMPGFVCRASSPCSSSTYATLPDMLAAELSPTCPRPARRSCTRSHGRPCPLLRPARPSCARRSARPQLQPHRLLLGHTEDG